MFCNKCGANLPDGSYQCTQCGASLNSPQQPAAEGYQQPAAEGYQQPAAEGYQQPAAQGYQQPAYSDPYGYGAQPQALAPKKGLTKQQLILIAAGAAVVVLVIILICALSGGGYKGAIKNGIKFMETGKLTYAKKLAPKEYTEYLIDEYYDGDKDDFWDDVCDNSDDDYKYSYTIKKAEKLDKNDLDDLRDEYESICENWDMDVDDVSAAYEVKIRVTTTDDDGEKYNDTSTVTVFKYKGKWYVVDFILKLYYIAAYSPHGW